MTLIQFFALWCVVSVALGLALGPVFAGDKDEI